MDCKPVGALMPDWGRQREGRVEEGSTLKVVPNDQ